MNKNQYIIKYIKKIAGEFDSPADEERAKKNPSANKPTNQSDQLSSPNETKPSNKPTVRPASYGLAAVKEMQQAILDFVGVAASTDVTSMTGNQQGQQYGQQTRALPGQLVAG